MFLRLRPTNAFNAPIAPNVALLVCAAAAAVRGESLEWVRQLGTSTTDFSYGVSADGLGNVYISGSTMGSLGGPNAGFEFDAFVSKYDAAGALQWSRQLGTSVRDLSYGVSADGLGSVYISGTTYGSLGGPTAGGVDAFVSKYDALGILQWSRQLGTNATDWSWGVSADGMGNVYISGYTLGNLDGPNAGGLDPFLSKYDAAGTLQWSRQLGTSAYDNSYGVSADGLGNVYISGYTDGSLGGPGAGSADAFVSKYDAAGSLQWTRQWGTSSYDQSYGVSADGLGNVYISGYTDGSSGVPSPDGRVAFVSKYDAAGILQWTRQLGTSDYDVNWGVSADGLGSVYISGATRGSLGGPNAGSTDAFVSKYDAAGNFQWTQQLGTSTSDPSYGVSSDGLGNVYLSGTTYGSLGGPNAGFSDAFVAKIADPVVPEPNTLLLLGFGSLAVLWRRRGLVCASILAAVVCAASAQAVTIDTVPVGNPGNAGDVQSQGTFGAVSYNYHISRTEVTNAQYAEFLNGVDPTGANTLALYNGNMTSNANGGINFNGGAGNGSKYEIKSGRDNNPVVFVSWYDSIRFANWMHNGMGGGDTENGAYTLLGGMPSPTNFNTITRNADSRWWLPSENEWYKAAYHKNDGTSGNYWDYPTSTDAVPYSDQPPGSGAPNPPNTANYVKNDGSANGYDDGFAVTGSTSFNSSQNYLTDVGASTSALSPYGTFDQGGNVSEWNEALMSCCSAPAGLRGGSWFDPSVNLLASTLVGTFPTEQGNFRIGFRVASIAVPEPNTLLLLGFGSLAVLLRRRSLVCAAMLVVALVGLQSPCARADSAVAWGSNGYGQLGIGTTTYHDPPVPVSGMDSGVTAVAAGGHHSLAIQNGGAFAWGLNLNGQLGDGTTTNRYTPVPVTGLSSGVTAIAAGGIGQDIEHSLAVQNGAVYAWGKNRDGQLGDGSFISSNTPVAVSGMGSGVTAIAAGHQHSLAVQNGGLYSWGSNTFGKLGNGTLATCCPLVNGRFPTPAAVIGMGSGVTAIAAGSDHSLAVKDGGVYSWGSNAYGALGHGSLGVPSPTPQLVTGLESGATAIAAGEQFSLAVVNGGVYHWSVYTGGTPVQVDPTTLFNMVAVAEFNCCTAYALSSDGSLWSWSNYITPYMPQHLLPPAGYKFTSIAAGYNHFVATLAAVPEPSTLLLLCCGSLALLRRRRGLVCALMLAVLVCAATSVQAVTIDMVRVGNPGNSPDLRYNLAPRPEGYGAVDHIYQIGKYEITAGQYTAFLNAVADTDPNELYNPLSANPGAFGANIQRTGSSPNYSYTIAADRANRPVNYVSFWDAARFTNWLHNGQPTGPQGPGTTEGGAYHNIGNQALFGRNVGAKFFIPTEDEWYKAAFHDKTAGLAATYFDYPTGTNAEPGNNINETTNPGNNANYRITNYVLGSPYYRTVWGEFELSDSPYGTFDQAGNVYEWNESVFASSRRGVRGGSYGGVFGEMHAAYNNPFFDTAPTWEFDHVGFRVASIPEPSTLLLLCCGSLAMLWRRRGIVRVSVLAAVFATFGADPVRGESVEWVRQLGTSSGDESYSVSADGLGNVYISGWTGGSLGGPSAGSNDGFVSKYDSAGNFQWTQQLGTNTPENKRGRGSFTG